MRAKHSTQRIRTLRRRRLALALVAAMAVPSAPVAMAQSLPQGGNVVSGTATINSVGNNTTINQSSRGAIIDWGSFNIASGFGVNFQNGTGVTLNRVIGFGYGPSASSINGSLTSTGTVFLINRAGIAFGGGATINVGGLIASTIDISNADFDAGVDSRNFVFGGGAGAGIGEITNFADITATTGGTIGFLGQSITNYGDIQATGGSVVFGAASAATITLDPFGDGLTQLVIQQPAAAGEGLIRNYYGSVSADGGQILMRTDNAAGGTTAGIINAGTLRARSLSSRAGRIELSAGTGNVLVGGFPDGFQPGVIDVSGGTFAGGSVLLSGDAVAVLSDPFNPGDASRIDASGGSDGGRVEMLATGTVALYEGATINADATNSGSGGDVTIAGGTLMAAFGSVSARGGSAGGNVLTYSGGDFDVRGFAVDAGSAGAAGTWTLWAPNIDVVDGEAVGSALAAAFGRELQDAEINRALDNGTNVTLRAGVAGNGGEVYFNPGVDIVYGTGSTPLTLRVDADGGIAGNDFRIGATAGALSIIFNSDASNLNNGFGGISFSLATLASNGGDISLFGQSDSGAGRASSYDTGIRLTDSSIDSGGGNVLLRGASTGIDAGDDDAGVVLDGTTIATTSGVVTIDGVGDGVTGGVALRNGSIATGTGTVSITGAGAAGAGIQAVSHDITTGGGGIGLDGVSAGGVGVQLGDGGAFAIGSGGGAISITGSGVTAGVLMRGIQVDSGGGAIDIDGHASGGQATGVDIAGARLTAGAGDVAVNGIAVNGSGVRFILSGITTTTGDISMTGIGGLTGLDLIRSELSTDSGHLDLRGRGMSGTNFSLPRGLLIESGTRIATNSGGIELSGEGAVGAGIYLLRGASVDAGNSLVILRAGNNGSRDAISIGGTISSDMGVNLRPGGVDANGELTERVGDEILVGGGTAGFALSGAELALIDAPELVIGSNLHAGAIRVLGITTRNGNLTLQNDGGGGGIDLQAAVDVGSGTLALSSGGSITQTSAGAITAHSLLARADGDVLLAVAGNNVAATTLAGSAGGDFQFQDVDALAIGNVSAIGFDATVGALSSFGANGITAGGDVFVRNLAGDLTLNAGVSATNIDLVTAGRLQNVAGASLVARGDWRVWANTWEGETRGGLAGSGNLPNLYGCAYLGACGVTVPGDDNHFIYVQQPTALVTFDSFSREYGLPNPLFTFSVTGAILGDTAANVASGSATTTATIGSDVGNYAISGNFLSAAGYRIQFVPGNLAITPATLFFTADNFVRYLGTVNPTLTGSVTGFRNDDTLQGVFGSGAIWSTPAGLLSPIGYYPVNGGTTARNYVFSQAPGNATALRIIPLPQLPSTPIDYIRETVNTYLYDRNIGGAPVCAINASMADQQLASAGDELSNEWSKVRSRPNLTNCFESERKNSCGDF